MRTWLNDLLFDTFGSGLEEAVKASGNAISKWMLMTPKIIEYEWIVNLWWYIMAISVALQLLGFVSSIIGILFFKKDLKTLMKVFGLTLVLSSGSLYLSDYTIGTINLLSNSLMSETIEKEILLTLDERKILYTKTEYDQTDEVYMKMRAEYDINETADDLSIGDLNGARIMRDAYGGMPKGEEDLPVFKTFALEYGGEGFGTMLFAMGLQRSIGMVGIGRYFILAIIGAGAPLWITLSVFTGNYDPMRGYFSILIKMVSIHLIFNLAWLFSNYITSSDSFSYLPKQAMVNLIFFAALIISIFLILFSVINAVKNPLTLSGDKIRERHGNMKKSLGKGVMSVGSTFGSSTMIQRGSEMAALGEAEQDIANKRMESQYDKPSYSELDSIKENFEFDYLAKSRKENVLSDFDYQKTISNTKYKGINAVGIKDSEIKTLMKNSPYEKLLHEYDDSVAIDDRYTEEASKLLSKHFEAEYLNPNVFEGSEGFSYTNQERLEEVKSFLDEYGLDHDELVNFKVSSKEINYLKDLVANTKEYKGEIHPMPDDTIGFNIFEEGKAADMKKVLDFNNIAYTQSGNVKDGLTLLVDQTEYEDMLERSKLADEILKKSTINSNGSIDILLDQESEELDYYREALTGVGVKHEELDSLWFDEESKKEYLEQMNFFSKDVNKSKSLECVNYAISNQYSFDQVRKEIKALYPGSIINEDHKNNILIVDIKHQEDVNSYFKSYQKKQAYWTDQSGHFYYQDEKLKKRIKTAEEPKNGRYLGFI